MSKKKTTISSIILLIALVATGYFVSVTPITQAQKLNKQCQNFGNDFIKAHDAVVEKGTKVTFFYSKRTDTCLMTEVDELGNVYSIYDIKRNYIKQEMDDPRLMAQLFNCDKDGVDNAVLAKVEKYDGKLYHLPYSEFLDNGEGGKPRALETPSKEFTREMCQPFYNVKLKELK